VRLLSASEHVEMPSGLVVARPGSAIDHVYFPESGLISMETVIDGDVRLEVGMVGHEGMWGANLAQGVAISSLHACVREAGVAWCVDSATFRSQLADSAALRGMLGRYSYVVSTQLALAMGCQHFHLLGARLARWMLMRHDRAHGDTFLVTQESLGQLLGVRRVSVTTEAGALQGGGLIAYSRGTVTVLDRKGLENAACSCYAMDRDIYRLFVSKTGPATVLT
jgi:CRP-like cAMP-binding protein